MLPNNYKLTQKIIPLCEDLCVDHDLIGGCIYGSKIYGYEDVDSPYDCLLIMQDYERGIRYNYRGLEKKIKISFLMVDKELFEIDINNGKVGDFLSNRILTPYVPIKNSEYLLKKEILFKKRVIEEELESLIIEYGEISRSLIIKPEYFALARMVKRAKLYPPLGYNYSKILDDPKAIESIMMGFNEAMKEISKEGHIIIDGKNLSPTSEFIDKVISKRTFRKVVNIIDQSKASLYSYLMHGKAGLVDLETISKELTYRTKKDLSKMVRRKPMKDPKDLLYLKVSKGTVCLNDKRSIIEIINRMKPGMNSKITPLAGVLNEVYLVESNDERLVAKKFTDWHSLKWFALNIIALGAKTFFLSGKNRMENEIGISNILSQNKIYVPSIIHVSLPRGILFREYIEGSVISKIVKDNINRDKISKTSEDCFYRLGNVFAKIHEIGIELGDTKPENFIIDYDGKIFAIDLEQSKKNDEPSWDIAEFLFYSGHYAILPKNGLKQMINSFVSGYLETGKSETLRKASSLSYIKVFSLWTPPQVIYNISEILRNSEV